MKNLLWTIAAMICAAACMNTHVNESTDSIRINSWRDNVPGTFIPDSLRHTGDTIGYVVGCFGKSTTDTLYCIAIGCQYYMSPDSIDEYNTYVNNMDTYRFSNAL